ncbi:MAG: hypothetical protein RR782_07635 [Clostridium sp.]
MALLRLCSICNCKVKYGTKCECEVKRQKERYKEYKANRQDKDMQRFYSRQEWLDLRELLITSLYGLDIIELLINKRIVHGDIVHHIIETKEDDSRMLDISNLIYVTRGNHEKIHSVYNKNLKAKRELQSKLFNLLKQFKDDFS